MHNKLSMYQPVMEIFNNYKINKMFDLHVISAKCPSQIYKILLVASFSSLLTGNFDSICLTKIHKSWFVTLKKTEASYGNYPKPTA